MLFFVFQRHIPVWRTFCHKQFSHYHIILRYYHYIFDHDERNKNRMRRNYYDSNDVIKKLVSMAQAAVGRHQGKCAGMWFMCCSDITSSYHPIIYIFDDDGTNETITECVGITMISMVFLRSFSPWHMLGFQWRYMYQYRYVICDFIIYLMPPYHLYLWRQTKQ